MRHAKFCFAILPFIVVGCWEPSNGWPQPSAGVASTSGDRSRLPGTTAKANSMISKSEAVAIARKEIGNAVKLQKGAPIEVVLNGNVYTVTYVHVNSPNVLGASFDARVTIDAMTGKVLLSERAP